MVSTPTTLFDTYDALYEMLNTTLGASGSQWRVFDGEPRETIGEFDYLAAILGSTGWDNQPAGMGAGPSAPFPLDEQYQIQIRLAVWDGTLDQSRSRSIIRDAYESILAAVRINPTLSVPGVLWTHIGIVNFEQSPTEASGSACQIDLFINIKARLS